MRPNLPSAIVVLAVGSLPVHGCGDDDGGATSTSSATSGDSSSTTGVADAESDTGAETSTSGGASSSSGSPPDDTTGGDSGSSSSGGSDTSGGEAVIACGVEDPWLCEDFERADPLSAWEEIKLAGNQVSVQMADSPTESQVLVAETTATAISHVAVIRREVPEADGATVLAAGSWVNLSPECLGPAHVSVLNLTLTDLAGGGLAGQLTVWLRANDGYVFVAPNIPGMTATSFDFAHTVGPDQWHRLGVVYEPASGAVALTIDGASVIDDQATVMLGDPLSVEIDGGFSGSGLESACRMLQDDIYLAPG